MSVLQTDIRPARSIPLFLIERGLLAVHILYYLNSGIVIAWFPGEESMLTMKKRTLLSIIALLGLLLIVGTNAYAQQDLPDGVKIYRDLPYVSNAGNSRMLDIYMPSDVMTSGAKKPALIIAIHGGAFLFGDKKEQKVAPFLRAGYAVASINYRLIPEAIWPAQIEDCKAAVRWLRANARKYGYNPKYIGAFGESAGGHLVAMLGTAGDTKKFDTGENLDEKSSVQAVVDYFGPTDFVQMDAHRLPNSWTADNADSPASRLIGGPIQQNKDKVETANPITYISDSTCPFMIAHGDQDMIVPYHQSVLLADALKKANIYCEFYTLKGVGHGFNDKDTDAKAVEFFDNHLIPHSRKH